jgi:diguanylate cyclase (GGDEF)-like protein
MKRSISYRTEVSDTSTLRYTSSSIGLLSLAAIVSTFCLSMSPADDGSKASGFVVIIAAYLTGYVALYLRQRSRIRSHNDAVIATRSSADIAKHLGGLDDAREFFAGSLRTVDVFRLVSSRLDALVDFTGLSLLLVDRISEQLLVAETTGVAVYAKGSKLDREKSAAGKCFYERDVTSDLVGLSAAIPLCRDIEVYGVLLVEFADAKTLAATNMSVLAAVGERVSPLILSSLAFERSHSNALTDFTTDLPNERAFHLVLENRVAESVRQGISRPLTILTFDVNGFDELAAKYGHATGDRLLNFVAGTVKDALRQMDFLARAQADEFLVLMPTATKEVSHEVIVRIQTLLFGRKIKVSDTDAIQVELNFGWASFGLDGETPASLLAVARERREQNSSQMTSPVLWFPQDHAN